MTTLILGVRGGVDSREGGPMSFLGKTALLVFGVPVALMMLVDIGHDAQYTKSPVVSSPPAPKSEDEKRADGRFNLTTLAVGLVRRSMKKPESFELESVQLMKDNWTCVTYYARNSFNDRVRAAVVISPEYRAWGSDQSHAAQGFARIWNRHCQGRDDGYDMTGPVEYALKYVK